MNIIPKIQCFHKLKKSYSILLTLPNHRLDANDRPGLFIQSKKRHTVVLRAWKKNTQIHVNVHKSCRLDDSDELLWNYVGSAIQLDQHLLGRLYRIWLYIEMQCVVASVHPLLTEHGLASWQAPLDLMRSDRWSLWFALTGLFCTKYRRWILFPISYSGVRGGDSRND